MLYWQPPLNILKFNICGQEAFYSPIKEPRTARTPPAPTINVATILPIVAPTPLAPTINVATMETPGKEPRAIIRPIVTAN